MRDDPPLSKIWLILGLIVFIGSLLILISPKTRSTEQLKGLNEGLKVELDNQLIVIQGSALKAVSPPVIPKMKVMATITSYNAVKWQTDSTPCISASGRNVCLYPEQVIACPARLPFGTKVEIDNKIYVCEDRMASRFRYQGWYFDILMEDIKSAKNWGRQVREVIIY